MRDILNFVQITDRVGTAGQPTRQQFKDIADAGYHAVINLAMHDSENAIDNEGNLVASRGMCYVHIPVPFDNPTVEDLRHFLSVMAAFDDERVFVHCAMNYRVSAFMYHYLRQSGVSETDATSPILDKWLPRMDPVWTRFMALSP